jgi:L-fucose mutarotase
LRPAGRLAKRFATIKPKRVSGVKARTAGEGRVLIGLDPLLSPDLLWLLAAMGHGDDLALVDANHPAERIARGTASGRLVRLPGLDMGRVAHAILSVFPLDDAEPDPVRCMEAPGQPALPVQEEVQRAVDAVRGRHGPMARIGRFAFYDVAQRSFGVVQVGDPRPYGCFLLRKGVVAAAGPSRGAGVGDG